MKEKTMIFVPFAGLCNRVNAIMSAIALIENYPNVAVRCFWPKDKDCYAKFSDLFNPLDIERLGVYTLKNPFWNFPSIRNFQIPKYLRHLCGYTQRSSIGSNEPIEEWIGEKKIYVSSSNRFHPLLSKVKMGDIFKPTKEIEIAIADYTSRYSNYTVGVHVRRTDNRGAIENSPLDIFYRYMDDEMVSNLETKFYLASDDESVKAKKKSRYGDKLIIGNWELKRNSVQGMKDAVAELYCLARTNKILGSSCSTYSLMASQLNDIPLVIVKKN